MKKNILTVVFVLGLISVFLAQTFNSQKLEKKCSSIAEGLQFCTASPVVAVELGENIPITLSLKNRTEWTIIVPMIGGFYQLYDVTVTDSNGNEVLSHQQLLQKKILEKTVTDTELVNSLPIYSGPFGFEEEIAPQAELKILYNLNDFYDFKKKGKYQVEVSRKIPKQDGTGLTPLSLGTIDIEVK